MKTAISVHDRLFERVEKYAKEEKISRSQLFSEAVEEYLDKREKESLRQKVNAICDKIETSIDPVWLEKQSRVLSKEEW